jgi:acetyl-CoA synthetase
MLTELEKRRNFPLSAYRTIASLNSRLMKIDNKNIESHLKEKRVFKPAKEFAQKAKIKNLAQYQRMYRESIKKPDKFWSREARELSWQKPWRKVLEWKAPFAKWFIGGKINLSENCLDRHLTTHRRNKAAILWEGEPGEKRTLTYLQLHREVCRFANVLKRHKIGKGDRIHDCGATAVITADGSYRRGGIVPLKKNVDDALRGRTSIKRVIVFQRAYNEIHMEEGRDVWWHRELEYVDDNCPPAALDSEHPLYILYTSGSTGKPKGILHTTGGYLVGINSTTKYVFDIRDEDIFWCTADVGWVTGHSYVVYGPLANGATTFMYEGAPNWPEPDRFWQIIEQNRVNILYTAPTAIRAFIRWGDQWVKKHDLSSLRLLGTVGEPINPEAWMWYHKTIGGGRCPVVDTWWQTETGAIMITPLPGGIPTKPGSATLPFFGVDPAVVDSNGKEVGANVGGKLIIRRPWPSMLRTIYGDKERYKKQYWSEYKGKYFTGDGARRDEDGYYWIVGRIDDVLNVAGHRLGTSEIESALVSHIKVAEAAVVGRPDELKGQSVVAFVTVKTGVDASNDLKVELRNHVGTHIGAIAKPDEVRFAEALPKTRSGKIMRRLLKEIASGATVTGDTTTLEDFSVLAKLAESEE